MSRGWSLFLPLAVPFSLAAVALCAGPLAAQTASPAPSAAAPSAAVAPAPAPNAAAPVPAADAPKPAPAPNPADVQRAQDHCAPGSDCANALREPSPVGPGKPAAKAPRELEPGQPLVGFGSPALAAPGGLASAAEAPTRPITFSAYFILGAGG